MTSTDIVCTFPESYLHVTQALLDDQKKFYRASTYNEIVKHLESELYANKGEDVIYEYAVKAVIDFIRTKQAEAQG